MGRNSILEKQPQKIFDCLNEPEALAKIEAQHFYNMKNLFFSLVFMLIGSFAFANNGVNNKDANESFFYEYLYVVNSSGVNTCYARFCWNSSETVRTCSEWVEVPCGATIDLEGKSTASIQQ